MVISGRTDASNSPRRLPEGPDTRQENPIRAATPRQNLVRDTDLPPPPDGRHQRNQHSNRMVHVARRDIPGPPFNPTARKERQWLEPVQRRGQKQSTYHVQTTEAKPARRDNHSGLAKIPELKHKTWKPTISCGNKEKMGYLRTYAIDAAYPGTTEN